MLKISLLFKKNTDFMGYTSRILTIKNAKLSGYHFYMNLNVWGDFQICISVPLRKNNDKTNSFSISYVLIFQLYFHQVNILYNQF